MARTMAFTTMVGSVSAMPGCMRFVSKNTYSSIPSESTLSVSMVNTHRRRKTAAVRWPIYRYGKNSSTGHCLEATGYTTTSMMRLIWKTNGRKRIGRLTQITFLAVKPMPAYGNTQRVTANDCFPFERRGP